ncbi:MAG: hypothetical protein HYU64_11040 [Armatimonadetes bacterium]|nr:hypothetical protein [Armatimonadota bacterium]
MADLQEIGRLSKTDTTDIVFSVVKNDKSSIPKVDIREFVRSPKYEGFTKSGLRFAAELLPEFIDICKKLDDATESK